MKKGLRYLIEGELEKAEVVLAAKSITDAIQKMAETAAKWEADDVMPLNDPIREHFGPEAAAAFSESVSGKLRELVKNLGDTKNAISDEIARMQGEMSGEPQDDLSTMDDDSDMGGDAPSGEDSDLSMELPDDNADAAPEADMAAPEGDAPPMDAPKFDDAGEGSMKAAGRARKESAEPKGKMLENLDRAVAKEYAGLIREGKSAQDAAGVLTESYGLSINDLFEIVSAYRK